MSSNQNPLAQDPPAGDPPANPPADPPSGDPAPPSNDPWYRMVDENGAFKEGAWSNFPVEDGEDLGKFERLGAKTPDFNTLVRNTIQLENLLSNEKLPLPKEGDGPEAWDRVWSALGRPEEAKYNLPAGVEIPEAEQAAIDAVFHKAGITQSQADAMYHQISEIMGQNASASEDASEQAIEAAIASLESEVGPRDGSGYENALNRAELVAEHLGLNDPELFKVPGFAAKMHSLHDTLIDSRIPGDEGSTISKGQNIQEQIDDILHNPANRLYQDYRSGVQSAHDHVLKLMEQLQQLQAADSV